MKNLKNVFLILFFLFVLTSCFTSQDDISKVKQGILSWGIVEQENIDVEEIEKEEKQEEKIEKYTIKYLTQEKFLIIDSLDDNDFLSLEVEITWKTLASVDKIIVNFSNIESKFPEDSYTLQSYKKWDNTFKYRAFSKYEVIDKWVNKYIIEAYSWDKVSKIELILNVFEEKKVETTDENISDEKRKDNTSDAVLKKMDIELFPKSEIFWNPLHLGNGKITYSDIKWLEINEVWDIDLELDVDSVTSYLTDKIDWWFFWNTLRPIKWDAGVSFYVTRLEDDAYFYEKHYYTWSGYYGILGLEKWEWVDIDNLSEKNTELKEKNEDFIITTISDTLFKQILD